MTYRFVPMCVFALLAASCRAPLPVPESNSQGAPVAQNLALSEAAQRFAIDPAQSWLRTRVYRSGRLAKFGHNHVMMSQGLEGQIVLGDVDAQARITVTLPLESLVVDDPLARAAEGAEFDGTIPDKDRAATRKNMLGAALLNAAAYPDITLRSVRIEGARPDLVVVTDVTIAGQTRRIDLPVTVEVTDDTITAVGDFVVTHEALGLEPFSALLGALRVRDDIGLHFTLVAEATDDMDDATL